MALLRFIFRGIWRKIVYFLELVEMIIASIELFISRRRERKLIRPILAKQMFFTGFEGLKLIGIIALVMGGMILFLVDSLSKTIFFNKNLLGDLMSQIILRELAPLFTAIIVIGRSATAIATEIGNMSVNHEIEALESIGVDPLHFLVAPRIIGMTFSMIFLVLYFFFIAMIGGYIFATLFFSLQLPFDEYLQIVFTQMELSDIGMAMLKSFFFGVFVAAIACYKGLKIQKSITFVPVVATQTVVSSMSTVFFFYAYFTILFFV